MMAPAACAAAGLFKRVGRPRVDSGPLRGDGPGVLQITDPTLATIN